MPRLKQSPEQAGNTALMAEISRGMQIKNKPDHAARVYMGISDTAWYRRRNEMKEFYDIMTLETAYIYHDVLGLDFVIEDGRVSEVKKSPSPDAAE